MSNKRDITINKVEGIPSKFGTGGAHICVPKEWSKRHYNRKVRREDKSGRGQVERDEKA
jgi:hypothetical protein